MNDFLTVPELEARLARLQDSTQRYMELATEQIGRLVATIAELAMRLERLEQRR